MRFARGLAVAAATRTVLTLAAVGTGAHLAYAQQYSAPSGPAVPPPPAPAVSAPLLLVSPPVPSPLAPLLASELQLIAYPYFWMPGLNMAITTPLARAPQVNVSIGSGEMVSDLNNAPFMGAA